MMPYAPQATLPRYEALDGLRGAAALLVVLYHVEILGANWPNHLLGNHFIQNGYLAVDLFFVLSGFVISANYMERINSVAQCWSFLVTRFFRIYPLHLLMLIVLVLLELLKLFGQSHGLIQSAQSAFSGDRSLEGLMANIFLVNGLHVSDVASWNGPSWSISCEWAAYIVFGLGVLVGVVQKKSFMLAVLPIAMIGYLTLAISYNTLDLTANWGIVRCLASFFSGFVVYQLREQMISHLGIRMIVFLEVAATVALLTIMSYADGSWIVACIPAFSILVASLQFERGPLAMFFKMRWAQSLGRISYSVYMVHVVIVIVFAVLIRRGPGLAHIPPLTEPLVGDAILLVALGVVVLTANTTYSLIEEPWRLYGRQWVVGRQKLRTSPESLT